MSKATKIDDLSSVIAQYLKEYGDDITEEVKETVNSVCEQARDELEKNSPKRINQRESPYYRGWTIKNGNKSDNVYRKEIYNKTNYQLTHLLEFGHVTKDGKRTKAKPHIRPVEEKYVKEFESELTKKLRRS